MLYSSKAVVAVLREKLGAAVDAEVTVSCAGGSFVVSYVVSIPTGTLVTDAAAAQEHFDATFSNATATEEALQARLSASGSNVLLDIQAIVAPYVQGNNVTGPTTACRTTTVTGQSWHGSAQSLA